MPTVHEQIASQFSFYCRQIRATLRKSGVSSEDVEDLTQDVLVVAIRRCRDFEEDRPLGPWLCGIARRVAADHRRLARNRYAHDAFDAELESRRERAIEPRWVYRNTATRLIGTIPPADGDLLYRRYVLEESMREISSALGIPLFTGYSRLRVARGHARATEQATSWLAA